MQKPVITNFMDIIKSQCEDTLSFIFILFIFIF